MSDRVDTDRLRYLADNLEPEAGSQLDGKLRTRVLGLIKQVRRTADHLDHLEEKCRRQSDHLCEIGGACEAWRERDDVRATDVVRAASEHVDKAMEAPA